MKSGKGLGCIANPLAGNNDLYDMEKVAEKKKYAIVGGGLSGLELAYNLSKKGYDVDLYEKDKLGGQFNLAYLPPKKGNLKKIIEYYKELISQFGIEPIKKDVTSADLLSKNYSGIILATGSKPFIPPIEGLKDYSWAEILEEDISNKKVVIIGGGLIGIEVAHTLLHKNNEVIIVEMLSEVARGMEAIEKALTMKSLKEANVPIYVNTKVVKVENNKVYTEGEHNLVIGNVDRIVISTGMKSYNPLYEELKDKLPVYVIGDARKVAKAQDAIKSGFELAKEL